MHINHGSGEGFAERLPSVTAIAAVARSVDVRGQKCVCTFRALPRLRTLRRFATWLQTIRARVLCVHEVSRTFTLSAGAAHFADVDHHQPRGLCSA